MQPLKYFVLDLTKYSVRKQLTKEAATQKMSITLPFTYTLSKYLDFPMRALPRGGYAH